MSQTGAVPAKPINKKTSSLMYDKFGLESEGMTPLERRSAISGYDLKYRIEGLVAGITDKEIKHIYRGDGAATAPGMMILPRIVATSLFPKKHVDILLGYTAHEICHQLQTDFEKLEKFFADPNFDNKSKNHIKQFWNAIDDYRIEKLTNKIYPGFKIFINHTRDFSAERFCERVDAGLYNDELLSNPYKIGAVALTWVGAELNGYHTKAPKTALSKLDSNLRAWVEGWKNELALVETNDDAWNLAFKIYEELEDMRNNPEESENSDDSEESDDSNQSNKTKSKENTQNSESSGDDQDTDSEKESNDNKADHEENSEEDDSEDGHSENSQSEEDKSSSHKDSSETDQNDQNDDSSGDCGSQDNQDDDNSSDHNKEEQSDESEQGSNSETNETSPQEASSESEGRGKNGDPEESEEDKTGEDKQNDQTGNSPSDQDSDEDSSSQSDSAGSIDCDNGSSDNSGSEEKQSDKSNSQKSSGDGSSGQSSFDQESEDDSEDIASDVSEGSEKSKRPRLKIDSDADKVNSEEADLEIEDLARVINSQKGPEAEIAKIKDENDLSCIGADDSNKTEIIKRSQLNYYNVRKNIGSGGGRAAGILRRMLQSRSRSTWRGGKEEGRLDFGRLVPMTQGHPDVYQQRSERIGVNTAVSLLLDNSGSMTGNPLRVCQETSVVLDMAIQGTKTNLEVNGFTSLDFRDPVVYRYRAFGQSGQAAAASLGNMTNVRTGGTPVSVPLLESWRRLSHQKEPRKIMIVVSDGGADGNDEQAARLAHDFIISQGCPVLGISIGCSNLMKKWCDNVQSIDSIEELPVALTNLVREVLK